MSAKFKKRAQTEASTNRAKVPIPRKMAKTEAKPRQNKQVEKSNSNIEYEILKVENRLQEQEIVKYHQEISKITQEVFNCINT